ncbi:MAG: N-acetylmuramoyl-L-alanine amidase [Acidaminococcus intestini]|uniref:N-acetylmuramoyl-L-alanine amidase n=1 Tax=Acidaminococcus intestini TaxID=187327 RepID=A0A943EKJ8_9FIRM|nr:N-acetylmuramoyl-L-alanine amidase [Acidaminococcus intestini]
MQKVTLEQVKELAEKAKNSLWDYAEGEGYGPKIYLHWTAGRYKQQFPEYHINIDMDGTIYAMTDDFAEYLTHTWRRNTGSLGVALCCAYGAGSETLGDFPPTPKQIEAMAQVIAALSDILEVPITKEYVLTHGEAANNEDGIYYLHAGYAWWNDEYGDGDTRGDLEYLGTHESPSYNPYATDGSRGGDVLRGKAIWYQNEWRKKSE